MKKILLTALMIGSVAGAATITQTISLGPSVPTINVPSTFLKWTQGPGQTLQSVTISVDASIVGGDLGIDNDGAGSLTGSAQFGGEVEVQGTDAGEILVNAFIESVVATAANDTGSITLAADNGDGVVFDFTSPDGGFFNGAGVSASDSDTTTDPTFLNAFTATGGDPNFPVNALGSGYQELGVFGGAQTASNPVTITGEVVLTYTYTEIPEPASFALFGLLSLVFLRLRR